VSDSWVRLDKFWVKDDTTQEIVRHPNEEIVEFKSAELQVIDAEVVEHARAAGIVLIGVEGQMQEILQHFGPPSPFKRRTPQQLLAVACSHSSPDLLTDIASQGVSDDVWKLARKLRRDVPMGIRISGFEQVTRRLGTDLQRMGTHYCMASVHVPWDWQSITESKSQEEEHQRTEVWNQIDLSITAMGEFQGEPSMESAARRALSDCCSIEVSDFICDYTVQERLRKELSVDIPVHLEDDNGTSIIAVILPEDTVAARFRGVLCLSEASRGFVSTPAVVQASAANKGGEVDGPKMTQVSENKASIPPVSQDSAADVAGKPDGSTMVQGKTIAEWQEEQDQFDGEPKLPPGWLRIRSRTTKIVYYFNMYTTEATFKLPKLPLPNGWQEQKSKTTGQTYYWNRKEGKSSFEPPAL